jgi:hypothetical protein
MTAAWQLVAMAGAALVAAACGTTKPARFYTLDATATAAAGAPVAMVAVIVGPVAVPAAVDRPQVVVQVAPNRVELDEFNRWAAPLPDAIARVVAGDLAVLLGTPRVATAPLANFDPTHRVTVDVQRFDSVPGQAAVLEAVWAVRRTAATASRSGRTTARETVATADVDALVAAHSRALAAMSRDIAAAIRADAAGAR